LYQHVKDHVVIFSEAKERLSRMQSQARLGYAEAIVSRRAVKPGLPYEIHFLLKLKNHGEGLEGSQEFAGIYFKSL